MMPRVERVLTRAESRVSHAERSRRVVAMDRRARVRRRRDCDGDRPDRSISDRAIAFYARNGFVADGIELIDPSDANCVELRMIR
jgi:hypothetical protein